MPTPAPNRGTMTAPTDRVIELARRMCATHREPDLTAVRNELRAALVELDGATPLAAGLCWGCSGPTTDPRP